MLDAGSIVEDTNVRVVHLIVTDEHQSRNVNTLITVRLGCCGGFADAVESVVNLTNKLLVINVSSTDYNEVVTKVVGSLVGSKIVSSQVAEVVSITLNGLTHHMVSVCVEV